MLKVRYDRLLRFSEFGSIGLKDFLFWHLYEEKGFILKEGRFIIMEELDN